MRYPFNRRPLREINGSLYEVIADYPIDKVVNASEIKKWLNCDTAFRVGHEGIYMFCVKIEEAQIIEEYDK
jgi:hypothetical protein